MRKQGQSMRILWANAPSYPKALERFLEEELKLNSKYFLLELTERFAPLTRLLLNGQNTLVVASIYRDLVNLFREQFAGQQKRHALYVSQERMALENDALDACFIDLSLFSRFEIKRFAKELERILRLNSYVLLLHQGLWLAGGEFTEELYHCLQKEAYPQMPALVEKKRLEEFYTAGCEERYFYQRQKMGKQELLNFLFAQEKDFIAKETFTENIERIFNQYADQGGEVELCLKTTVFYGVFNKYTPAISLRKSIFFHTLRPFAFVFYVLLKINLYVLRFLINFKDQLLGKGDKGNGQHGE